MDDVLLIGNDVDMLISTKVWLSSKFSVKDLEDVTFILGICIYKERERGD